MPNRLLRAAFGVFLASAAVSRADENSASLRVGVVTPLSGVRADAGQYTRKSLELFHEDLVNRGDRVQFIFEDSRYEPAVALTAAKKLIEVDKVRFIIGAYGSAETMAIAPAAEKERVLLISPGAQIDELSTAGDYVFRVIHNVSQEAPWFAQFVAGHSRSGTLHFLTITTGIGPAYVRLFRPPFERGGKKVGLTEEFSPTDTDFRAQLLRIKSRNPSDVFLVATPAHVHLILKQAAEIGLRAQFYNIGVEGPDILKDPQLAEGLLYPYSYDSMAEEPAVRSFAKRYREAYGEEPDTVAANVYDAATLLEQCCERPLCESDAVKRCLYATKGFKGASGTFSIDEHGDAVKELLVKTVKGGRFVRYEPAGRR